MGSCMLSSVVMVTLAPSMLLSGGQQWVAIIGKRKIIVWHLCLLFFTSPSVSFVSNSCVERKHNIYLTRQLKGHRDGGVESESRRKVFEMVAQAPLILMQAPFIQTADAATNIGLLGGNSVSEISDDTASIGLDCLLDLPPRNEKCVRVFLCRHGQTENNRLRLVQGARVNVPINSIGELQATRLGKALVQLNKGIATNEIDIIIPTSYLHSQLQRAQQTAKVALQEVQNSLHVTDRPSFTIRPLPSLGEVDFGPIAEGKKVAEVKPDMARIYGAWSLGKIDKRLSPGAESGREVLNRIVDTLESLLAVAHESPSKSVVAVSHGTFLRMLLACVLDVSLLEASGFDMKNGAINVIDIDMSATKTLRAKCNLLGGPLSQVEKSFSISFPNANVVRKNEIRHLEGLI